VQRRHIEHIDSHAGQRHRKIGRPFPGLLRLFFKTGDLTPFIDFQHSQFSGKPPRILNGRDSSATAMTGMETYQLAVIHFVDMVGDED